MNGRCAEAATTAMGGAASAVAVAGSGGMAASAAAVLTGASPALDCGVPTWRHQWLGLVGGPLRAAVPLWWATTQLSVIYSKAHALF